MKSTSIAIGLIALLALVLSSCSTTSFKEGVHQAADNVTGAADKVGDMADNFNKACSQFLEQLNKPSEDLNTGVSYWIELKRDGKTSRVTSKNVFHNGDKIRFHLKPNANVYGYMVMLQEDSSDAAVLFPRDEDKQKKMVAGEEIVLPVPDDDSAWLKFDNRPGVEMVRMVLSRKQIDAEKLTKDTDEEIITIGSGDKADKVPDKSAVGMVDDEAASSRNLSVVSSKDQTSKKGETTVINSDPKKPLIVDIALRHNS